MKNECLHVHRYISSARSRHRMPNKSGNKKAASETGLLPAVPPRAAVGATLLLSISLALCLLALFQWMELLVVAKGGSAVCALSAEVNCTTVWSSSLATQVQSLLGIPVAGLGL